MISHRCKNCMWWDNEHEYLGDYKPVRGYCRKHKPIPAGQNGRYIGEWPIVHRLDFCGEFREDK